jgi:predicted acetyltransferase
VNRGTTHSKNITIEVSNLDDYKLIINMGRFYEYEISSECGMPWEGEDGGYLSRHSVNNYKTYFEDLSRRAYLIKICDEIAGFVLLNQVVTDPATNWNMGEFFILAKFQKQRIGTEVAHKIWHLHPGFWEVPVLPINARALRFWRRAIYGLVGKQYREETKIVDYDQQNPERIIFGFATTDNVQDILIRTMIIADIPIVVGAFKEANWLKPEETFQRYLEEQSLGTRIIWLAEVNNKFAGYITLKWQSSYEPFLLANIPEIMDLNVLPKYRSCGIGSKLLRTAEKEAATKGDTVGIGVGLYGEPDGGYGTAQRLYIKRGYMPDGRGVTYNYTNVAPGDNVRLDNELVLWFSKEL